MTIKTWLCNVHVYYCIHYMYIVQCTLTVLTPDCYKKMSKKCNSPGIFSGLVVYLGLCFRKFGKKSETNCKM